MRIKAGEQVIEISDLRVSGDYAIVNHETMLTAEQMAALKTQPWQVYAVSQDIEGQEIETLVNSYTGYNEQLELALTLKRGISLQDELMQKKDAIELKEKELEHMAKALPDSEAVKHKEYFVVWEIPHKGGLVLNEGDRFVCEGTLYKSIDPRQHTTKPDTHPRDVATSYVIVNDPNQTEHPYWKPSAYGAGTMVFHEGKVWISDIDSNTREPGTTDSNWTEAIEPEATEPEATEAAPIKR